MSGKACGVHIAHHLSLSPFSRWEKRGEEEREKSENKEVQR